MTIPIATSALAAQNADPPLTLRWEARFWRVCIALGLASSWIGLRAEKARAQASALYLFFYYLGSSVAGTLVGWALARAGWPGVAAFVGILAAAALAVALRPSRAPPPAHLRS